MRFLSFVGMMGLFCMTLAPARADVAPVAVTLPAPRLDGKVSVEKALKLRRSLRTPSAAALALGDVGQLCWAAQGITDDKGHRTASSALATYPLEVYVIAGNVTGLAPGIYHYLPARHVLTLVAAGDKRAEFEKKAVGQGWIAQAPAIFIITGVVERVAQRVSFFTDRVATFMNIEAGLAAQGFFLQATALGLGSTFVGGFKLDPAREFLALPVGETPLAVLPVGARGIGPAH